ncbi:MAG: PhnD/SsuA/transferrin family substrate-binding protein [Hyphomicrobiales bacterium]|nr:PhnD/SsuA/transferrin family substrate-binding protein [Hyphomicrobiales bacterium]
MNARVNFDPAPPSSCSRFDCGSGGNDCGRGAGETALCRGTVPANADRHRKAYEPFFKHLADTLGRAYELVVTTDWAGIAMALGNGQVDVAWMGPWGLRPCAS